MKLRKRIAFLEDESKRVANRMFMLENPIVFKYGDKVLIRDWESIGDDDYEYFYKVTIKDSKYVISPDIITGIIYTVDTGDRIEEIMSIAVFSESMECEFKKKGYLDKSFDTKK